MCKVISVSLHKGGVGKTSLVSNLAGILSLKKKKVLIIDMDGQGNISDAFGLEEEENKTTYNVFKGNINIKKAITPYDEYINIIQAGEDLSSLEFEILPNLKRISDPFLLFEPHLEIIKNCYDYVFIDTPPSLGLMTGNALAASDYVLVPFVPEMYSIKGFQRLMSAIEDLKERGYKLEVLAIVPMMVNIRTNLHKELLKSAREYAGKNNIFMTETFIPKSITFSNAEAYKQKPATLLSKPTTNAIEMYYSLYDELIKEIEKKRSN